MIEPQSLERRFKCRRVHLFGFIVTTQLFQGTSKKCDTVECVLALGAIALLFVFVRTSDRLLGLLVPTRPQTAVSKVVHYLEGVCVVSSHFGKTPLHNTLLELYCVFRPTQEGKDHSQVVKYP